MAADADIARAQPELDDVDSLWDFNDPAESERRFRDLLDRARHRGGDRDQIDVVKTQLARSLGLQRRFAEAHEVLDEICPRGADDSIMSRVPKVAAQYLLERGRVFNSSGNAERAGGLFDRAWEVARDAGLDGLAIDSLHMLAIVSGSSAEALRWNQLALEMSQSSRDGRARRWRGSILNNIGWALHAAGEFERALAHFEDALRAREEAGDPGLVAVARWCIARTLRSLGRIDEALAAQRELLAEHDRRGGSDGFVHEEIGECLIALGREDEARPHFGRAAEILSRDAFLASKEPGRLERLRMLAWTEDERDRWCETRD
jgi:tetratricopeptide (TPR) repeat protein